jgi:hypothetical protein
MDVVKTKGRRSERVQSGKRGGGRSHGAPGQSDQLAAHRETNLNFSQ